jgi:glycerol-3-phosphate dehydrogenase subunit B
MGGGLVAKKQSLVEPIFQLPVVNPVNQGEQARFLSPAGQVFLQAGLEVDGQLRPPDGFANLYAVGSLLAHSNYAAEKSGLGIALATGYKAGCLA